MTQEYKSLFCFKAPLWSAAIFKRINDTLIFKCNVETEKGIFTIVSFEHMFRTQIYKLNAPEYKKSKSVFLKEIFLSHNKRNNVTSLAILFIILLVGGVAITASIYVSSSKPIELHKYSMALLFLYLVLPGLTMNLFLAANYISNKPLRKAIYNEMTNIFAQITEH